MTKTVFTLLLLALPGTAALAAPVETPQTHAFSAASAVLGGAIQPPAAAPAPAPAELTLYDGKAAGPTTLSVADWGGGSGQDSTETYLFGGHSLKVTTLDLFQGAQITFPTPVSVAGDYRVFQMTLRRGGATLHYDPRTTSALPPGEAPNGAGGPAAGGGGGPSFAGGPSSAGGGAAGGFGGGGQFGGGQFGGGGFQGRGGRRGGFQGRGGRRRGQGGGAEAPPVIPPITNLRLSFTFADGRQADILRPVPDASDAIGGEGWYNVNVPVSALKLGGGPLPLLKSVTVGGDHYGVFFVGRIKLGTDSPTQAITIDGLDSVLPGQPVTLTAKGASPFSALKFSWDLDGSGGGNDQPTGEEATARYFEAGQDHTVTLTVTDLDGLKTPVTLTKTIHVKEQGNGPGNAPGFPPGNAPGAPQGNGAGASGL